MPMTDEVQRGLTRTRRADERTGRGLQAGAMLSLGASDVSRHLGFQGLMEALGHPRQDRCHDITAECLPALLAESTAVRNYSPLPWKQVHRHASTLPQVSQTCGRVWRTLSNFPCPNREQLPVSNEL